MTGIASTCGRASRCGTVSASAAATNTSVVLSLRCRLRNLVSSAKVAAIAPAASTTGPLQPDDRIGLGVEHLRQPLRRNPGLAAHGEGIDVGLRHRAMVEDPLPDGDLPHRIGIDQQPVSGQHEQRIDDDADPQRQQAAQRAGVLGAMGDGHGHRRGRISLRVSGRIEACQGIILGKSAARRTSAERPRKPGFGHITARRLQQSGCVKRSPAHRRPPEALFR